MNQLKNQKNNQITSFLLKDNNLKIFNSKAGKFFCAIGWSQIVKLLQKSPDRTESRENGEKEPHLATLLSPHLGKRSRRENTFSINLNYLK
uniref:Uncharacterized protein n=1 Tax=Romanomermis culicivorax TaxID=13658 RepID=A0A915KJG2_ROMCU